MVRNTITVLGVIFLAGCSTPRKVAVATPPAAQSTPRQREDRDRDRDHDRVGEHDRDTDADREGEVAERLFPAVGERRERGDDEAEEAKAGPEGLKTIGDRRAPAGGHVDPMKYVQAREWVQRMPQFSLSGGTTLPVSALPVSTQPTSLNGWANIGLNDIGGRSRSLVIHPTDSQTMWVGATSGGVWKTTNGGQSWTPQTDNIDLDFINALTIDPTNPNVLYAGTGESATVGYEGLRGLGILKTTDGGNTWSRLAGTMTPDFYWVNKITVSKVNPQRVYAATSTGVFQSLDGGSTWKKSLAAPQAGLSAGIPGCMDLAMRTDTTTDYLFVGCVGGFNFAGGIWRNTDAAGSGTWTEVQNLSTPPVGISLALAPSNQGIVYALVANSQTPQYSYLNSLQSVLRSTSNGDAGSWTVQDSNSNPVLLNTLLLNYPSGSCAGPTADAEKIGFGQYNMDIEVDPTNPNTVWVLGIDVFRSDDGGMNWGIAGFWDTFGISYIHADQKKLVFANGYNGTTNQSVYVVNDGGVYRSDNSKAATVTGQNALCQNSSFSYTGETIVWHDLNSNFMTTQFYHGSVYPGGTYIGGAQDEGYYRGNLAFPPPGAINISGGDGYVSRIDPTDSSVFYLEQSGLSLARYSAGGGTLRELVDNLNDFIAGYSAFVLDPSDSRRIYWAGRLLWQSGDQGDTWKSISPDTLDYITAIAVSPLDPQRVIVGNATDGNIYATSSALTASATAGWTIVKPRSGTVSDLAFSPGDPNVVYATYSTFNSAPGDNHVYKSVDSGRSWTGIDGGSAGIPDIPVSSILIDPQNPYLIYLGSDMGVFISTDGGATWAHDGSSFPQTYVHALALDRGAGAAYLYAFTFGRGIWRTPLGGALTGTVAAAAPCTYSVSPLNVTGDVAGSLNSVTVNTAPGCAWSAQVIKGYVQIQPPASGVGPGTVYFTMSPNPANSARPPNTFMVQGQTVTVSGQPAGVLVSPNDTTATAAPIPSIPYAGGTQSFMPFSTEGSDPIHSCTGSADQQTVWWTYTASSSGFVKFAGDSQRFGVPFGEGGIVLTAYQAGKVNRGGELGCYTLPRSTVTPPAPGGFIFAVQAGVTYYLELSNTTTDFNYNYIVVSASSGPSSFSIFPASATIGVSGSQKFATQVTNVLTPLARWSISPQVGSIDVNGNYTAPTSLSAAATVNVTAVSMSDPALTATATLTVNSAPVAISAVTNAASFLADPLSPGEMVTIFGNGLGPASLAGAQIDSSGNVASSVSQTQFTFDGVPAPIIYVSAGQSTVMVPYEVAGKPSTKIVATYQGQSSAPFAVPVTNSAPALFAQTGGKQGAILNYFSSTPTVNTQQSPATAGTTIALFATGEGVINPAPLDGQLNNGPTFPAPLLPVTVTIGGQPAQIGYAGEAPGGVAGFLQVNCVVPKGLAAGAQPVVLTIGSNISSGYVTVWVK